MRSSEDVYIADLFPFLNNCGPGTRIGLWVSGCELGCRGCFTPELWARSAGRPVRAGVLACRIAALAPGHDGLTLSGGEPFEQAGPLAEVLEEIRALTSLDVMAYSGYTLDEIRAGGTDRARLLSMVDVLVDGRFREDLPTARIWRGSANQEMHLLTARARRYSRFVDAEEDGRRRIHMRVSHDGRIHVVGIPGPGFMSDLSARLREKGIESTRPARGAPDACGAEVI